MLASYCLVDLESNTPYSQSSQLFALAFVAERFHIKLWRPLLAQSRHSQLHQNLGNDAGERMTRLKRIPHWPHPKRLAPALSPTTEPIRAVWLR
jgi:hypothetical protein